MNHFFCYMTHTRRVVFLFFKNTGGVLNEKVWSVLLVLQMLFLVAACVEVDPSNADKYDLTVSVYDYAGNKKVDR